MQWVLVFDSNIVKTPIIHTKAEAFIWLLIEKNRCFDKRFERLDKAIS